VPRLPLVLCCFSSLLASVCNVMPPGSCVKAWPRCLHQQDGHCVLTASEGCMACQAGCGAGGPWSLALCVPGDRRCTRVPDAARAWAGGQRGGSVPPHPSPVAALRCRSHGLLLAGLCAADRDAVEGVPWPGSPRGWAELGSRSPGLRLLAAVFLLGGDARYAALAPASRPARRAPQRRWVPALTPAPFAWAARRKQENQKLQRPAAQRPGERSARFSPPPRKRPWEAQPPLRDAAAHSPQKKHLGRTLFL
jgi:hypothetical protein